MRQYHPNTPQEHPKPYVFYSVNDRPERIYTEEECMKSCRKDDVYYIFRDQFTNETFTVHEYDVYVEYVSNDYTENANAIAYIPVDAPNELVVVDKDTYKTTSHGASFDTLADAFAITQVTLPEAQVFVSLYQKTRFDSLVNQLLDRPY